MIKVVIRSIGYFADFYGFFIAKVAYQRSFVTVKKFSCGELL